MSIEVSPESLEYEFASQVVGTLSDNKLRDFVPLTRMMRTFHTGTDFFGRKLTREELNTLLHNLKAFKKMLVHKYGNDFENDHSLDHPKVRFLVARNEL